MREKERQREKEIVGVKEELRETERVVTLFGTANAWAQFLGLVLFLVVLLILGPSLGVVLQFDLVLGAVFTSLTPF